MDEDLVTRMARMIEATLGAVPADEWVPINRFEFPAQEVPGAPPEGPELN